jgi:hypothetical protein
MNATLYLKAGQSGAQASWGTVTPFIAIRENNEGLSSAMFVGFPKGTNKEKLDAIADAINAALASVKAEELADV